ncbi:MAG: IreB family regulatory phosphoprotein [Clostridia bacterium]|nr:IreB family regulatory phosphoprotein [Clostridia bacterium]
MAGQTMPINLTEKKAQDIKSTIRDVYNALDEKGYDAINQLAGYIISEDPTYITSHNNARVNITRLDRFDILTEILNNYFNK